MFSALLKGALFSLLLLGSGDCATSGNSTLPVIDLGYVKQQATSYNETYGFHIFRNVRYAAPPLGDLRFRKPQPPLTQSTIQNGDIPFPQSACHQAVPPSLAYRSPIKSFGSEDCLFLDIYVPTAIKTTDCVPVLVWIHGGAYVLGSKELLGDPTVLIKSADEPVIYVSINYRLGSFGWLSTPEQPDLDMNVGLHDTRAALEWVKTYIPKFGGDEDRVTVMGISAGGGIIMHHITSEGGEGEPLPFHQAIVQSPGFDLKKTKYPVRIAQYQSFEKNANCSSLKCLREASTETLKAANTAVISGPENVIGFGPVVDGDYVLDIPIRLLAQGEYHHSLKSLISSNLGFEAGYFFPYPENVTEGMLDSYLDNTFAAAPESLKKKFASLYPYNGPGIPEWRRVGALVGDIVFNCNSLWLARSFKKSYRYNFDIPPAYHGDDIPYTFYTGPNSAVKNDTAAVIHQEYITDYTVYGEPGCGGTAPCFPKYGKWADTLSLNLTEVKVVRDPWNSERCELIVDLVAYA